MPVGNGEVLEIWLEGEQVAGRIRLPGTMRPAPGQYLLAKITDERMLEPLPEALFPGAGLPTALDDGPEGMLDVAGPLPPSWLPGLGLRLRGPLGRGFQPGPARRLALAVLGNTASRLLPLARPALLSGAAVTLFSDQPLPPGLPLEMEAYPLEALPEYFDWADFLAIDVPVNQIQLLSRSLGKPPGARLSLEAQVLIDTPMPCGAVAECGVCAVRTRAGWKLACKDGPVFNLRDLEW